MTDMTAPNIAEQAREAAADAPGRLATLAERGAEKAQSGLTTAKQALGRFSERFREHPVRNSVPVLAGAVAVTGAIAVASRMGRKPQRGRRRR